MAKHISNDLIVVEHARLLSDSTHMELGLAGIDDNHHEFSELHQALLQTEDDILFKAIYHELHMHTEKHFKEELAYMQTCEFPAIYEHHADHLRILNELVHYRMRINQGRIKSVKGFLHERLGPWFQRHVNGADAAMAFYPTQQMLQGFERK